MSSIKTDREDDGRFIAVLPRLPGVFAYGRTEREARRKVLALAWRVIADRRRHGESPPRIRLNGTARRDAAASLRKQ